jgi:hypothetical protein
MGIKVVIGDALDVTAVEEAMLEMNPFTPSLARLAVFPKMVSEQII